MDQTSSTVPDTTVDTTGLTYTSGAWPTASGTSTSGPSMAAGNGGTTGTYTVKIDTTGPTAISGLASSTHPSQTNWYSNNTPAFSWSASTDAGSGMAGYSYVMDQSAGTVPDTTVETTGLTYTSTARADGVWYFHVRAVDSRRQRRRHQHLHGQYRHQRRRRWEGDNAPAVWQPSGTTVTVAATDNASGVAGVQYRKGTSGSWLSATMIDSTHAPDSPSLLLPITQTTA